MRRVGEVCSIMCNTYRIFNLSPPNGMGWGETDIYKSSHKSPASSKLVSS